MTIGKAKAIATAIISGRNIWVIRGKIVHLQIAVVKGVHVLVAEDKHVDWLGTSHITELSIRSPRHVITQRRTQMAVHRNAADAPAIIG